MTFEFDPEKSKSNQKKHGIYFEEAQKLWDDPNRLVIAAKNIDEQRFLLIGKLENQYWSAIYTVRDDRIRLISVRRSRNNEKEIYES